MTTIEDQFPRATSSPPPIALRIDEVMPRFDVNVVQHIIVNADPGETYHAVLDADLMDNQLTHLMVTARDHPNRLREEVRHGATSVESPVEATPDIPDARCGRGGVGSGGTS